MIFAFRNHKNSQKNQERQDLAHCRPSDALTMRPPSNQGRSMTFGLKITISSTLLFIFLFPVYPSLRGIPLAIAKEPFLPLQLFYYYQKKTLKLLLLKLSSLSTQLTIYYNNIIIISVAYYLIF